MRNPMSRNNARRMLAAGLVLVAVAAGCSSTKDYSGSAKKYIEGDLSKQIGLGDLTAKCDDVASDVKVGDTFNCTADTADGVTVELVATVAAGDKVDVETTNLITADGMTVIENAAVTILEQKTGATIGAGALDCGAGPKVIDVANEKLSCVLTSPDTGSKYETTITLDGLKADSNMSVEVADQPMA